MCELLRSRRFGSCRHRSLVYYEVSHLYSRTSIPPCLTAGQQIIFRKFKNVDVELIDGGFKAAGTLYIALLYLSVY